MHSLILTDWKMFTDFIEEYTINSQKWYSLIQYRGQSNKSWNLQSSLNRLVSGDPISEKKAEGYETHAQYDFLSEVHLINEKISYNQNDHNQALWVDMQHYSCPTRLLDWSESPYVALYFAINDSFNNAGALYVWDVRFFNKNIQKAYPHHQEVKGSEIIGFKDFDTVSIIFPKRKNERMVRQQACFSMSNTILKAHDDIIETIAKKANDLSGLYKLEIPKELKLDFMNRLKQMNITPDSLFPGLDGLGRSIKETLMLRKWAKQ